VVLRWGRGSEALLREGKERRGVLDPKAITYYLSLSKKSLKGGGAR